MSFDGGNPTPHVTGRDELEGKVNYFIGNDPAKWRTGVPTYGKVSYQGLYPGVDLVYYGNSHQLEYDLVVQPGADPSRIWLRFQGVDSLDVGDDGDLHLQTARAEVRQRKPFIYQEVDGRRVEVSGGYVLEEGRVGFELAAYDRSCQLVIDPVIEYSTYLGGKSFDTGRAIAVDNQGNAYVTGETLSTGFPTVSPVDSSYSGTDAFVTKLNASGSALVYSTYLGGTFFESGRGIAVDPQGNAYVAGATESPDFPTNGFLVDSTLAGRDAFVTKLNSSGSALLYSTYLGGKSFDDGLDIAVNAEGGAYVTGLTGSSDFPTLCILVCDRTVNGPSDAFVTLLHSAGFVINSTFLGGGGDDVGSSIAVDTHKNVYVTGMTRSPDFPVRSAFDSKHGGHSDAFVAKLSMNGFLSFVLEYSTYLGGSARDFGFAIAVDTLGNAYVTGETSSLDFPLVSAFDSTQGGGPSDAFVTKLNTTGSALDYSTYLGGSENDGGFAIAVDTVGTAHLTGFTASPDFPTFAALDRGLEGADAFVTSLNATGSLVQSTYLGGGQVEIGWGIAVDTLGDAYVTGSTDSSDFPTTESAFDRTIADEDVFVTKIEMDSGYEIVTRQEFLPPLTGASVSVSCSTGNKVLSGGFSIENPGFVKVLSSSPGHQGAFSDRHWSVLAHNTDPSNTLQVQVSAICVSARLLAGHQIVFNRVVLDPSIAAHVNVTCPGANKVFGGGFSVETADFVRVYGSHPSDGNAFSDRHWNVTVHNTDPNHARQVTTSAVCASASLFVGYEIQFNQLLVPASSFANVNAACSSGKQVFGGGFSIDPAFVDLFTSEASDGQGTYGDLQWNVSVFNTDQNDQIVNVSAICAEL